MGMGTTTPPAAGLGRRLVGAVAVAVVVCLVLITWATIHQTGVEPLVGRTVPHRPTIIGAGLLEFLTGLSLLATVGGLLAAAVFAPATRSDHHLRASGGRHAAFAARAAWAWAGGAALMVLFSAAYNNGVPVTSVAASPAVFVDATQLSAAWLAQAVVAVAVGLLARSARSLGAVLAALAAALLAALLPVVTGNVTVGADHDLGTDGSILATLAMTVWLGAAVAVALRTRRDAPRRAVAAWVRRYQVVAAGAAAVALPARTLQGWFELAGTSPFASVYGALLLGMAALLAVLLWRWRSRAADLRAGRLHRACAAVVGDVPVAVAWTALAAITSYLPPPRFAIPQPDIQVNFLGYPVNEAPTPASLVLPGRPSVLLVVIALSAAAADLAGVRRLRRAGGAWPTGRLVSWLVGWGLVLLVSAAGVWSVSAAALSAHMVVHMTINMVAPPLIVLGGPLTLAQAALPDAGDRWVPSPRHLVVAARGWPALTRLLHPVVVFVVFLGSFFAIYLNDLFGVLMKYHWTHQLMMVHFLVWGCLFYGQIVGPDRPPRPLPGVAKLAYLFAAMPFHALFAVLVLTTDAVIGEQFYRSIEVPWVPDLMADQWLAGALTWITGELPLFGIVVVLGWQWLRQDQRERQGGLAGTTPARGVGSGGGFVEPGRAVPGGFGLEDSGDAYELVLTELAERKGRDPVD